MNKKIGYELNRIEKQKKRGNFLYNLGKLIFFTGGVMVTLYKAEMPTNLKPRGLLFEEHQDTIEYKVKPKYGIQDSLEKSLDTAKYEAHRGNQYKEGVYNAR